MYLPFLPWSSWPTEFPLHQTARPIPDFVPICQVILGNPSPSWVLVYLICNMRVLKKIPANILSTALAFDWPPQLITCISSYSFISLLLFSFTAQCICYGVFTGFQLFTVSLPYLTITLMNKRSTFTFYYNCIPRT